MENLQVSLRVFIGNCLIFLYRSRNVYLRITDGKKYCYYSVYAWLSTIVLGVLAVAAHFMLDYPVVIKSKYSDEQETIGKMLCWILVVSNGCFRFVGYYHIFRTCSLHHLGQCLFLCDHRQSNQQNEYLWPYTP